MNPSPAKGKARRKLHTGKPSVQFDEEREVVKTSLLLYYGKHKPKDIKPEKKKVGKNDPCPCGSGKKYKKCCMGKEKS